MPVTHNALSAEQCAKLVELLNRRLADAINLMLQSKHAYWNLKGPHYTDLCELFDKVAEGMEENVNLIAERIVQLGGIAEGTVHAVARRSSLNEYLPMSTNGQDHIDALSTNLVAFSKHAHYSSKQATTLMDADTADLFTQVAQGIDEWLRFVEMNLSAGG